MGEFVCACLCPIEFSTPALAIAAARAPGGVGILDGEFGELGSAEARDTMARLVAGAPAGGTIGLRLHAGQLAAAQPLLALIAERRHAIVIAGWDAGTLSEVAARLPETQARQLWLEVDRAEQLAAAAAANFTGFVARGSECGGRIGERSAFLLAQELSQKARPFWVQGGIGLHSAAACRAAGAAGVVLGEQLLLMKESPLPDQWRELYARISAEDCAAAGEGAGERIRFAARPDLPAAHALARRARELEGDPDARASWKKETRRLGWGAPDERVWPIGLAVGFAAGFARRFRTVGRAIAAVRDGSAAQLDDAARRPCLGPDAPLARSHRTRHPIVQGPMTRVSDRASFAAAVAEAGGLPMLALALMRGPEVAPLLDETRRLLGDRPWGVGVLGFVPAELRAEQLAAVEQARPPFALIGGGRPDQAAVLERHGIATYLHTPTPSLLKLFLAQGARRFVLEGSECGGHVGPLSSLTLWSSAVDVLLDEVTPEDAAAIHVLFAGGVHDARSAAMVAALAQPLAARGVRVGVLLGTAYLFTTEAVETGAIVPEFQAQAIGCDRTVLVETGKGHAIRCAPNPFTETFRDTRERLRQGGRSAPEITFALEQLTLGRGRVASKGLVREEGGAIVPVDAARQRRDGMFMVGDLARLRSSVVTIRALHEEVSQGSARELAKLRAPEIAPGANATATPIAVIGVACRAPGAADADTLWRNLLDQRDAIREIPAARWDARLYFDPDPSAPDKTYSKWGGFIDPVRFDPLRFGVPPRALKSITIPQLLALDTARLALEDAGLGGGDFDRENTAVIFGVTNPADLQQLYVTRSTLPLCVPGVGEEILDRLPRWSDETFPGILDNVIAGRVANRFDLGGVNFTVDAACASSLCALDLAIRELESGRSNVAVTGGVDLEQTPYTYLSFAKTRALSPRGRAQPFDKKADGIVISEAVVVLVLKRLADAERDGDRIYGVIRAVAGSSDGKGLGLTAPKPAGQKLAMRRAYARAGLSPSSIGLYEAHGTGTAVGDAAELDTVIGVLGSAGAPAAACAIGSAKSLVGHTKAAAGMVGLIKALFALRHRALPPHAGVDDPLEPLGDPACPVYLLDQARPWSGDRPRRAGVSAFGFGGTNFHAVLEEYAGALSPPAPGAAAWPCELVLVRAESDQALRGELGRLRQALDRPARLRDLAFTCATARRAAPGARAVTLALVVRSVDELRAALDAALAGAPTPNAFRSPGAAQNEFHARQIDPGAPADNFPAPAIAFLFPGQGSQHVGMGREAALYFDEVREALALAADPPLGAVLFPPAATSRAARRAQEERLERTDVAQPAIAALSCGLYDLARRLGLAPGFAAGHSFGEYVALHAASALGREALYQLAAARGRLMTEAAEAAPGRGAMAAVKAAPETLRRFTALTIANYNAPDQCVLSGDGAAIDEALAALARDRVPARRLPVSGAFHSPLMEPAAAALAGAIRAVAFARLAFPVHGNSDGTPYPDAPDAIAARLAAHLLTPVKFVDQVERMYQAGARVFVEVGPKDTLTRLTGRILGERPHLAVALDGGGGGLRGLLLALARLAAAGVELDAAALFRGRECRRLELEKMAAGAGEPEGDWLIDGGRVWRADETSGAPGARPLVTEEESRAPRAPSFAPPVELPDFAAASGPLDASAALAAYQSYQKVMSQFVASQERMILGLIGRVEGGAPAALAMGPEPIVSPRAPKNGSAAKSPAPANGAALDRAELARALAALVAEHTGYPTEMLDPAVDVEAELGIDSIRRVEILTRFVDGLRARVGRPILDSLDQVTSVKTLGGVVDVLAAALAVAAPPAACARHVMAAHEAPLPPPAPARISGLHLVTEDRRGVARAVVGALRSRGATAEIISAEAPPPLERLAGLRAAHGPVRAILHLAPLSAGALDDWRAENLACNKNFFRLLRACARDPEALEAVIAATATGGWWGRREVTSGSAASGGVQGILKTLRAEHPSVRACAIDFDDALSADAIAARVLDARAADAPDSEVGFPGGRRVVFRPAPAPLDGRAPDRSWIPSAGDVVLVTGGARGITAEIALRLAAPGVEFVIVGRAPADAPEPPGAPDAPDALRAHLIAAARRDGDGATPAELERRLRQIVEARERRRNLAALVAAGAAVDYRACDVRDDAAVAALLGDLYRARGRVDAVVHGAGLIEDKLIADKSDDAFDRVFDTKADGTRALARHLRAEGLRWVVLFGSISGRFGNRGQVDYAAGNEVMNRLAWRMAAAWPRARVVAINWGPWRGAGMADQRVLQKLGERGLGAIDVESGWRFFADELTRGRKDEVEVIAGDLPGS